MKDFKDIRAEVFNESNLGKEPTTDEIVSAILQMLGALQFVEGPQFTAFPEMVKDALRKFDNPTLRTSLTYRLYRPEWYVEKSK